MVHGKSVETSVCWEMVGRSQIFEDLRYHKILKSFMERSYMVRFLFKQNFL